MILYKLISTPNANYLYDTNKNKLCKINVQQYEALKKYEKIIENNECIKNDKRLDDLMQNGFLGDNLILVIEHPDTKILHELISNSMSQMTLQLTQSCNLRCSYCIYSGNYYNRKHNYKKMDFELAKNSINYFFKNSSHSNDLAIGFYGGEPLLRFNFIKRCVEYAESTNHGKHLYFTITTNGTLLSKGVAEFLCNHNFQITLSLDGPSEQHDKNRKFINGKGSFEVILKNLNSILKNNPDFTKNIMINTVITPYHDLEVLMHFFDEHPFFKNIETQFIEVDQTDIKEEKFQNFPQKYFIIRRYLYFLYLLSMIGKYPKEKLSKLTPQTEYLSNLFYQNIRKSHGSSSICHHGGPCVPGAHRLFVDSDGNYYPCERLTEGTRDACIGNTEEGIDFKKASEILNIGKITESECKNCWCIHLCDMCVKKTLYQGKISKNQKLKSCRMTCKQKYNLLKEICLFSDFDYKFKDLRGSI